MSTTWSHVLKFYDSLWTDASHFCHSAIFLVQFIFINVIILGVLDIEAIMVSILHVIKSFIILSGHFLPPFSVLSLFPITLLEPIVKLCSTLKWHKWYTKCHCNKWHETRKSFNYILTYSLEQSPWEANRFFASQEILRILWNPKVHYRFYNCPLPVLIQRLINPVHGSHLTSWKSILILSSHLRQGLPRSQLNYVYRIRGLFKALCKISKATFGSIMSVRLSAYPHGKTRLSLRGF